jgi:hypothetical protein
MNLQGRKRSCVPLLAVFYRARSERKSTESLNEARESRRVTRWAPCEATEQEQNQYRSYCMKLRADMRSSVVRSMEGGVEDEFMWAGQGMPGTNVPGQRGREGPM